MAVARGPAPAERTIRLLDHDPDLARSVRAERRAEACLSTRATLVEVPRGEWTTRRLTGGRTAYGLLLLDGIASRAVMLEGIAAAELLGRGDLVPPADGHVDELVVTSIRWTVLEPLAIALLDERFLMTVRRWPEIVAALFERLAAQEERRAKHRALSQLPRVEDRLRALLWLLAERWGHVTPGGVRLRLPLTHDLLGQLVGAKRPTVTLAVKELQERGTLTRQADGTWLLARRQPSTPVAACEAPTGLDSGEPRWRR